MRVGTTRIVFDVPLTLWVIWDIIIVTIILFWGRKWSWDFIIAEQRSPNIFLIASKFLSRNQTLNSIRMTEIYTCTPDSSTLFCFRGIMVKCQFAFLQLTMTNSTIRTIIMSCILLFHLLLQTSEWVIRFGCSFCMCTWIGSEIQLHYGKSDVDAAVNIFLTQNIFQNSSSVQSFNR